MLLERVFPTPEALLQLHSKSVHCDNQLLQAKQHKSIAQFIAVFFAFAVE